MEIEMNRDTLEKLKEMKLYGMFNTFKASLENYGRNNMTIDKFVNMLVCNEWDERYKALSKGEPQIRDAAPAE